MTQPQGILMDGDDGTLSGMMFTGKASTTTSTTTTADLQVQEHDQAARSTFLPSENPASVVELSFLPELPPVAETVSSLTDDNHNSHSNVASRPRWYPSWKGQPIYHGNQEALGWAMDGTGRSIVFIGSGAFLGPALLQLAKEDAGCIDPITGATISADCDQRVYGIRPSSLLTTYTMVVGILSSVLLPIVGALIDSTPHRRRIGRTLSFVFCLFVFPQIFLNAQSWFAIAIIHIAEAFVGWAQTLLTYSYLPELTQSEVELTHFTQSFTLVNFGSMVLYLIFVVGVSTALGWSDNTTNNLVATARLGQAVSFVIATVLLYVAWSQLFQRRPVAHPLPPQASLWTYGFVQVYHTTCHLFHQYRSLWWFFISIAWIDSAIQSLVTIAITYLTDTLQFDARQNGIAVLLMLLGSMPGGILGGYTVTKSNPVVSSVLATVVLTVNTIVAAIVLVGPGQQLVTYVLAFVWGLGTGWKWMTDKTLISSILPIGQDTEMMGLYLFSGQILTWLPPLVYTILNEAGVSQRVGIGSLSIYFGLGILSLLGMGNYGHAVHLAGRMQENTTTAVSPHAGLHTAEDSEARQSPENGDDTPRDSVNGEIDLQDQLSTVRLTSLGRGVLSEE